LLQQAPWQQISPQTTSPELSQHSSSMHSSLVQQAAPAPDPQQISPFTQFDDAWHDPSMQFAGVQLSTVSQSDVVSTHPPPWQVAHTLSLQREDSLRGEQRFVAVTHSMQSSSKLNLSTQSICEQHCVPGSMQVWLIAPLSRVQHSSPVSQQVSPQHA